ncbi:short-chain dehydrogenase [Bordetella pertussis]|nr:short-chain dehydrogenase [Bordetella pertussis]CPK19012.1 short-chain dehydrogenase [Bordetella pertussis]CPM56111.1 short-chain dehydrogenase [Bordetella pertussis]
MSRHLLGLPEPDEIAAMAVFLASEESRHVTGSIFQIDGGRAAAA